MVIYENDEAINEIIRQLDKIPKEITTVQNIPIDKIADALYKKLKMKISLT